jgi:predicted 3-demethylubiquinone-9 3-methyltransferase (glyoxalase superfamily)
MDRNHNVRTCLWFERDGHKAAALYVSLVPGSFLETAIDPAAETSPLVVNFTLGGCPYMILTAGPMYRLSPAASIYVEVKDQQAIDTLWETLTSNGGEGSRCGWLIDRYGVSWQIIPEALGRLLGAADRAAAGRAQQAMMTMKKLNIAALESAFQAA